jgi:hypothetical protein
MNIIFNGVLSPMEFQSFIVLWETDILGELNQPYLSGIILSLSGTTKLKLGKNTFRVYQ